jgi:hypothetical protein
MPDLLKQALENTGWTIEIFNKSIIKAYKNYDSLTWKANEGMEIKSSDAIGVSNQISQSYSKQAVTWAAQRAGWTVNKTNQDNTINVTRR